MANDINKAILLGRLTRDSELKTLAGGSSVCNFAIAVNRRVKKGEEWKDEANYFDIQLYGKSGENLHQYLTKGRQVLVVGELRQQRWEQDGQTRSKVVVVAESVQLLASGQQQSTSGQTTSPAPAPSPAPATTAPTTPQAPVQPELTGGPEDFDDDIPF